MIVAQGTDGLGNSLSVSTGNVGAIELDGFPNPFKIAKKAVGAVLSVPKKLFGGGGGGSSAALEAATAEAREASKFPIVPVAIAGVVVLGAAAFLLMRPKASAARARRRGKR